MIEYFPYLRHLSLFEEENTSPRVVCLQLSEPSEHALVLVKVGDLTGRVQPLGQVLHHLRYGLKAGNQLFCLEEVLDY